MADEKYRVLKDEDLPAIQKLIPELKERIKYWHDSGVDSVFLAETSATPFGFILKQAWKEAYPEEKVPKFYRIDPRATSTIGMRYKYASDQRKHGRIISDYFAKRVNKDSKVVIFDPDSVAGRQVRHIKMNLEESGVNGENIIRDYGWFVLDSSKKDLNPYGEQNLSAVFNPHKLKFIWKDTSYESEERDNPIDKSIPSFSAEEIRLRGKVSRTVSGGNENAKYAAKTRDYIHDLKLIGKEAGDQLKTELHRKSLEGKITSVIAIGSLVISILFISNNITSNVIAVNPTASNLTGAILFIIGLVASLIYFKRR